MLQNGFNHHNFAFISTTEYMGAVMTHEEMTYERMKQSHEEQIRALLDDDQEAMSTIFGILGPERESHYSAWNLTARYPHSLFASLPGHCGCPVLIKQSPMDNDPEDKWSTLLSIANLDLIPRVVNTHTRFGEDQLREFSRVQLEARFPDHG